MTSRLEAVRARMAQGATLAAALQSAPDSGSSAGALVEAHAAAERVLFGAGEDIQRLLEDPGVTDVVVNARRVWVDAGQGLQPTGTVFGDEREVRALAVRLAAVCGQRLDDAAPIVDGVLPSGTRLHAVLPPLAADGTTISLRALHQRRFTLAALRAAGALDAQGERVLRALVEQRANVVVAGATGTGKTTLLAALLGLVDPAERIVCIEEASELRPEHPHVVHLQARAANVQAAGEVGLVDLVRAALRMRPDRIVLGEARGAEVRELLAALNTGHAGSWCTLHANSCADVPARLAALGALAGMSEHAVGVQAGAALDAVVLLRRLGGSRHLAEVAGISWAGGELVAAPALTWPGGAPGPAWAGFRERWLG